MSLDLHMICVQLPCRPNPNDLSFILHYILLEWDLCQVQTHYILLQVKIADLISQQYVLIGYSHFLYKKLYDNFILICHPVLPKF